MEKKHLGKTVLLIALSATLLGGTLPAQAAEIHPNEVTAIQPREIGEFMEYKDPNMDGEAIELQVIKKEDLEALSRIWTQLDERTRYLLEGYYILNLPATEIARELNIKPDSLRMALTRARKTAYQLLQDKSRQ